MIAEAIQFVDLRIVWSEDGTANKEVGIAVHCPQFRTLIEGLGEGCI